MPVNTDPHNEITFVIIGVIIVFLVLGGMLVYILLFYQKRKFQNMQRLTKMEKQFNETLLQTQLEIQEQTFQNISQEIHDNIGQTLSFIKLSINMIDIDKREIAEERLSESKTLLTKAIQDLRDLSKMLNTDFINDAGLANAIDQQLGILKKTGLYTVILEVHGKKEKYQLQSELVVFRIVQELLNNIVKHSEADQINIVMDYRQDKLYITVSDNGKGFNVNNESDGIGFRNMHSRIALIHGGIELISAPGKGTTAIIDLPRQKENGDGKT